MVLSLMLLYDLEFGCVPLHILILTLLWVPAVHKGRPAVRRPVDVPPQLKEDRHSPPLCSTGIQFLLASTKVSRLCTMASTADMPQALGMPVDISESVHNGNSFLKCGCDAVAFGAHYVRRVSCAPCRLMWTTVIRNSPPFALSQHQQASCEPCMSPA